MTSKRVDRGQNSRSLLLGGLTNTPDIPAVGPYTTDYVSGRLLAWKDAVPQRGGYVHRAWHHGTRDRGDE